MAVIKLTIGAVNITNYLIVVARKTTDPNTIAAQQAYAPEDLDAPVNVLLPDSGALDAGTYYVDYRESTDGETLGTLLGTFTYDATNKKPISETRYYLTNGPRDIDPEGDQTDLIDPYLDGKNITSIYKEGFRPLVPPGGDTESFKEYDLITGGGVKLLGGQLFNDNEVTVIEITYTLSYDDSASNAGLYDGVVLITEDTTLGTTHRNKCLKCESVSTKLVITLEDLSTVPDGKFYYFRSNRGSQKKVRILPATGDKILFAGVERDEVSLGLGESVRIEKATDIWEVVTEWKGQECVGERVTKGVKDTLNLVPEDGSLQDGDIEPRLFKFVHDLPATHKIIDDAVINIGYVHPEGKEGMFVQHSSLRKFRMPNSQGWYIKGLDDYDTYTGTGNRYPGATGQGQVGPHTHPLPFKKNDSSGGNQQNTLYNGIDNGAVNFPSTPATSINTGDGSGDTNEVNNIGDIFHRRS